MKPFKSIDEQIEILKERGLIIDDYEFAKKYLLHNNYYNVINAHSHFIYKNNNNNFIDNLTFKEIVAIHYFDKEVKSILFKHLLDSEKRFKSIVAYKFSEKYGSNDYPYLNVNNYNPKSIFEVTSTIAKISQIIQRKKSKPGNSISHYFQIYDNIPFWIITNELTFGQTLHLYDHFDISLRNSIAKEFSLILEDNLEVEGVRITPDDLYTTLNNLLEIRNILAHNNLMYYFKCRKNIPYITELHNLFDMKHDSPKNAVYDVFLALYCTLSYNQYVELHNTIRKRARTLNRNLVVIDANVVMNSLGFPDDWFNCPAKPTRN
ncbi:Abi family protein [Tannockella kyphosi]|uniref:Abi family protein n=1 Tax=Tannockella kyphosi TaxID=2899121 RepID=UPI0020118FA2|nr:Abi family protein [Tannockella kyphosi]